eukprot:scaffold73357_cov64-Phaeocystis_antarctica.AAC.3
MVAREDSYSPFKRELGVAPIGGRRLRQGEGTSSGRRLSQGLWRPCTAAGAGTGNEALATQVGSG